MKNLQKGFIVPLLLVIIALLLVGGGAYVYTQQKQDNQAVTGSSATQSTETTSPAEAVRTWCHTFNNNLVAENNTSEVATLKRILQTEKVLSASAGEYGLSYDESTGATYDKSISTAVMAFQSKYGITKTGTVDSATRVKLNSLYGCANAQRTVTASPSVTVLSPNGQERWPIGSTQKIVWNSNNFSGGVVYFELIDSRYNAATEDHQTHFVIANAVPNTGNYVWTIPSSSMGASGAVTPGSQYKIRISAYKTTSAGILDYDNLVQGDVSKAPFSITQ